MARRLPLRYSNIEKRYQQPGQRLWRKSAPFAPRGQWRQSTHGSVGSSNLVIMVAPTMVCVRWNRLVRSD